MIHESSGVVTTSATGARRIAMEFTMIKDRARTRALDEANRVFKTLKPQPAMTDYAKAQQSFQENRERLKAQRLARDLKGRENCR
jgi:hypothetical protein